MSVSLKRNISDEEFCCLLFNLFLLLPSNSLGLSVTEYMYVFGLVFILKKKNQSCSHCLDRASISWVTTSTIFSHTQFTGNATWPHVGPVFYLWRYVELCVLFKHKKAVKILAPALHADLKGRCLGIQTPLL